MRIRDCNWTQVGEYLRRGHRAVLPPGSTAQHSFGARALLSGPW